MAEFLMDRPRPFMSRLSCSLRSGSEDDTTSCFGHQEDVGDDQADADNPPDSEYPAPWHMSINIRSSEPYLIINKEGIKGPTR